jgi:aspartyl aminopeptidase
VQKIFPALALILACSLFLAAETPKDKAKPEDASHFRQDAWKRIGEAETKNVEALSSDFKNFLRVTRHELQAVAEAERLAKKRGFKPLESLARLRAGDRFYAKNRDRAMILGVMGRKPLAEGALLSASHIDAPRIELKANALYESGGFAMFQTTYHGGIKNYQWANVPLALVGRVTKKDGTSLDVAVGLDGEPWLVIPDTAPHEDKDYRERTQRQVLKGEELDPVAGSRPGADGVEKTVAAVLEKDYGIAREDFVSAQLALVPALPPGDVGLDRSMLGGYGLDDLLCSFAALHSLLDVDNPSRTALVYLAANEETGSGNVMGAGSSFLADTVLEILEKETGKPATLREHRRAMSEIHCVSADVTTGVHPTFAGAHEETNAARLGRGVVLKRYGQGEDSVTEVLAKVRTLLDDNKIPWQTHTYKVDVGGGGTLGGFLSDDGMDVVDIGVPILAMHAPWSVASKADLWWLHRFYAAFWGMK